jgi:thiol-disulfide isomerase/thioredoxin
MQTRLTRRLPAGPGLLAAALLANAPAGAADAVLRPWPAGQPTPPLQLAGLDGQDWDLARLRGKVVVVNFWATWCEPCVHELPVLGLLSRQDARVAVVGVNYKEPLDSIERFTAAHPVPYPVLRDRTGQNFKRWTAGVMPTTILVDRQGRARWRTVGEISADSPGLKQAIAALLAEDSTKQTR